MSKNLKPFTDRWLKYETVEKRTDFKHPTREGLQMRISPPNAKGKVSKTWSFVYRRKSDGKTRRMKIGNYPAMGLTKAQSIALELQTQVANGSQDPADEKQKQKKAETFKELAALYIERHAKQKKPKSWKNDYRMLEHDVIPQLGRFKVEDIEIHQITDILDDIVDRGAPYQSNRVLSLLRKIYNWANGGGICKNNPVRGVERRGAEEARDRILTDDEIQHLWNSLAETTMTPAMRIAFKLAILTGQRIGEVAGTAIEELDFEECVWSIPKERTKNKKHHAVPLSPSAVDAFSEAVELAGNSTFVFPSPIGEKPIDAKAPSKAFYRFKKAIGITDIRAHDLRRTAASGMIGLGVSEEIVGKVLNHTPTTVTGLHYNRHSYMKEKRWALEAWENHVMSIVEGRDAYPGNVTPMRKA